MDHKKSIKYVRHPCLKMNDKVLDVVQTYKYLGMTLDSSLTFTNYIKKAIKTIAHKVYILFKVRKYITEAAALTLLKTMVLPFFDYETALVLKERRYLRVSRVEVHERRPTAFQRVTYGENVSLSLSILPLQDHAEYSGHTYPRVVEALLKST